MITPTYEHFGTHDDSQYPELWEGCIGAWSAIIQRGGQQLIDFSGGGSNASLTNVTGSMWRQSYSLCGLQLSSGSCANVGDPTCLRLGTGDFSVLVRFVVASFPNHFANARTLFSKNDGSSYLEAFGYNSNGPDNQLGWIVFYVGGAGTPYPAGLATGVLTFSAKTIQTAWVVRRSGSLWVGLGNTETGPFSNSANISMPGSNLYIGARNGTALFHDGEMYEVMMYNRALSFDEIRMFADNIGAAFIPRRARRFYSFADTLLNRRRRLLLAA